jgi:hypothetical protein
VKSIALRALDEVDHARSSPTNTHVASRRCATFLGDVSTPCAGVSVRHLAAISGRYTFH